MATINTRIERLREKMRRYQNHRNAEPMTVAYYQTGSKPPVADIVFEVLAPVDPDYVVTTNAKQPGFEVVG